MGSVRALPGFAAREGLPGGAPHQRLGRTFLRRSPLPPATFSGSEPRPSLSAHAPRWPGGSPRTPRARTAPPPPTSNSLPTAFASGGNGGPAGTAPGQTDPGGDASPRFPPPDQALVRAWAGAGVYRTGPPLRRQARGDRTRRAREERGQLIRRRTVWRLVHEAALKPWR